MRRIGSALAAFLVAGGCSAVGAPTLEANGYRRVPTPPGCLEHVGGADRNIELAANLEEELLALIGGSGSRDLRCWYEQGARTLLVIVGDECGPHREAMFELGSVWAVTKTEEVRLVICDERRR
jgi:hypothetical protein